MILYVTHTHTPVVINYVPVVTLKQSTPTPPRFAVGLIMYRPDPISQVAISWSPSP